MTTQAGATAGAQAQATATEATAATVMGLAAAHAASPGAAVPATTAGAALRVGASKFRRTYLGLEGPGTRRGWGSET